MKAVIIPKPGKIEVIDNFPEPHINEYQVLVEQLACGICTGTDTKLVQGKFKGYDSYPGVLGHEAVGRVIEKGAKVRNYELGDLVLRTGLGPASIDPAISYCYGAFAEYGVAGDAKAIIEDGKLDESGLFAEKYRSQQVIPDTIHPVDGTILITFKEVYSALLRFGFSKEKTLLVFGLGPVGLSIVRFAKLLEMKNIVVCDLQDKKIDLGIKMGASAGFNSLKKSPDDWAKQHGDVKFDLIIDAVGVSSLMNVGLPLLAFNGSFCVYGIAPETSYKVDWSKAPYNWNLKFLQWPTMEEEASCHEQIIGWVTSGDLNPKEFYSHVLPLDQIKEGFDMLSKKKVLKVIIDFEK